MAKSTTKIMPPTADEIEIAKEGLCDKLNVAENQPVQEKCSAEIVFAKKKEMLEGLLIDGEIATIKDIIVNAVPIEKLYLFGSYAIGVEKEDSDYDFYVVIPNDGLRPIEAVQSIYRSFRGMKRKPMDILAGTIETFERRSKQITLERTIAKEGVLLYEKPRSA